MHAQKAVSTTADYTTADCTTADMRLTQRYNFQYQLPQVFGLGAKPLTQKLFNGKDGRPATKGSVMGVVSTGS